MSERIFIGGAWPYANYRLHIGHLASLLPGDIIARYFRQCGSQVIYVSGTDCFGTPITETARKENLHPMDVAKKFHEADVLDFQDLGFSYDNYGATFSDWHQTGVKKFFKIINDNGYLYKKENMQVFCENDNKFLSDREIGGICTECGSSTKGDQCDSCLSLLTPQDLKEKYCLICGEKTIMSPNKELAFLLSKFQRQQEEYFNSNKGNWRINAINETEKYLKQGLKDRDVTRNIDWGVHVPFEGYENKKIYVWVEAVLGYLTSGRQAAEKLNIDFDEFMKDTDNLRTYYVHGKDNIPFHTTIFPALIMALKKDIQLPKYIISSEYVNMGSEKMSKSKGNMITIRDLLDSCESDTIRFYFMMNNPEKRDIFFSYEDLVHVHNKILVGGFGNFINRNLSFLMKQFAGVVPSGIVNSDIIDITKKFYINIGNNIALGNFRVSIEEMIEYIQIANKYYDEQQPWVQVKTAPDIFANITATCLYMMANMSNLFAPVLVNGCGTLRDMLQISQDLCWNPINVKSNLKLVECPILYNRLELPQD